MARISDSATARAGLSLSALLLQEMIDAGVTTLDRARALMILAGAGMDAETQALLETYSRRLTARP